MDTSGSGTGAEDSSGSTGPAVSPFEESYSGTFMTTACQLPVDGVLSVMVDGAGVISGTAMAAGQTAAVTGTVDAVGSVLGDATIFGLGECNLAGDINLGLVGSGTFSCPTGPCSGTWVLAAA